MKNATALLFTLNFLIPGCTNTSLKKDDCSISINGVLFSKSINNGAKMTNQVTENKVVINSGPKSDFFNEPDGKQNYSNAPMLLSLINNKEPFTFVAKVSPAFSETYDAGAVYMYVNNNNWLKFAFELDEKKLARIVTVRTNGTSDDNNHDVIGDKSVYLKVSSNTESIGFYYSKDSINWQLVRVYKNDFPNSPFIGISSQSPLGSGISTTFESIVLTNKSVKDFRMGE